MSLVNKSTHIHTYYDQYMQIVTSIGTRENLHHIRAISSVSDILHIKIRQREKEKECLSTERVHERGCAIVFPRA